MLYIAMRPTRWSSERMMLRFTGGCLETTLFKKQQINSQAILNRNTGSASTGHKALYWQSSPEPGTL